jgi:hypothetical protein
VEGITLLDAPRDNIVFDGGWRSVRRVRFIGWFFRTDAEQGGFDINGRTTTGIRFSADREGQDLSMP